MTLRRTIRYFLFGLLIGVVSVSLLVALYIVLFKFSYIAISPQVSVPPTPPLPETLTGTSTQYLREEEAVIVPRTEGNGEEELLPLTQVLFEYIEVIDGCGPHFEGECVNVRSGPGLDYPVVAQLRNHMVLKVGGRVEHEGRTWYKVVFDEWLRYPERLMTDWYVAAEYVRILLDEGERFAVSTSSVASSTKVIHVNRGEQKLTATENGAMFLEIPISTGLALTPTPRGTFTVYKKTPSRYMQGPLPFAPDDYYDLPGVPWNLYFTEQGAVVHGAYWHNKFGSQYSHGCVNVDPQHAEMLYKWAEIGMQVVVE